MHATTLTRFTRITCIFAAALAVCAAALLIAPARALAYSCPYCGGSVTVEETVPSTCFANGYVLYSCNVCSKYSSEDTPVSGHQYIVVEEVPATCTEAGERYLECRWYGECSMSKTEPVAALGHRWNAGVNTATCTKSGTLTRTCSRCGASSTEQVAALGHDWKAETDSEATCTEDGVEKRTCRRCGEVETEKVAALGHDWGAWEVTLEATERSDGEQQRACARCGEVETEVIKRTGGESVPWIPIAIGAALVLCGGAFWLLRPRRVIPAIKDANGLTVMKLLDKRVAFGPFIDEAARGMRAALERKSYLKVCKDEPESLSAVPELAEEFGADLVVFELGEGCTLDDCLAVDCGEKTKRAIVGSAEAAEAVRPQLEAAKEAGTIIGFHALDDGSDRALAEVILPLYTPSFVYENRFELIGTAADLLGIPGVEALTIALKDAPDVKKTLEKRADSDTDEKLGVLLSIGSVLGFDDQIAAYENVRNVVESKKVPRE